MNYHDHQNENEKQKRFQQNKMIYDLKTTIVLLLGPLLRQPENFSYKDALWLF